MGTTGGNMEALGQAILSQARAEAEELKRHAQSRADAIRHRAQEAADRERKAILEQGNQEGQRRRVQAAASAHMKARSLELEHREKLLGRVFSEAAERLRSVPERKDYGEIVMQLVREALAQLQSGSAELIVDRMAHKLLAKGVLDDLSRETGVQLTLGKPLETGTGVVAQTPDGHLRFDNTLETRLSRVQGPIRAGVFRVLTGGAA